MRWNWWYPFFLFISKATCRRACNAIWVMCPPFCLFWTEMTCYRNMIGCATGSLIITSSKKCADLNLPRISCYILFFFYAAFHSQLQRNTEHPLFILLKDCLFMLLASQRLAQGRHPYYASCIVIISSVFFGAGIKLLQILLAQKNYSG